jgi:ABC-type multidrug transport system ATPase subunit
MLLRVLATLQAPRHGDALVAGHSVRRDRLGVRRAIGYVPQVTRFYPDVRVRHLLNYLAGLSGLHGRALDARCTQTLAAVHLTEHAGLRIKQLSGGLRQRLAIAQALVHEPSVLLADEPGSGLDPEEREHLRTLLAELALDRTVVVATHLTQDIAPVCTQLAVLQGGTVRFAGSPSDLAEQARGKVWQQLLPDAEVMAVLSGPRPVARVTRTAGGMLVRLIGSGGAGLQPVVEPPTVEEGYLALIGKEAQSCA